MPQPCCERYAGAVVKAPYRKIPRRSMPKAADRHCGKGVEETSREAHSIAAQWNVDVVTNPRAERNVPSVPKLDR